MHATDRKAGIRGRLAKEVAGAYPRLLNIVNILLSLATRK